MNKQYSEQEVQDLFKQALWEIDRKKVDRVDPLTRFSDIGLDSVLMFEVVGYLEDRLGVLFPDEKLAEINTLHDLHVLLNEVGQPMRDARSGG